MIPSEEQHHLAFTSKPQACSSSSLSSHAFTCSIQEQGGFHGRNVHHLHYNQEVGSHRQWEPESESDQGSRLYFWKNQRDENGSAKWMSSKMRLMRRMMSSDRRVAEAPKNIQVKMEDQKQASSPWKTNNSSSNFSNSPVRVCSDCNTTKTPLWRSGPKGPKSLCNACGIRQRKARRMAMAAGSSTLAAETPSPVKMKVQQKEKRHVAQYKKKSKPAMANSTMREGRKKVCFEDFLMSLSKNLAFHRVFPQDEKDAAILLMALSCGLVHG